MLQADKTTLDQLMTEAATAFQTRAKRRTPSLIYGFGQDDNLLALYFIAIGTAKVGLKRGLTIAADSAVIPRALVDCAANIPNGRHCTPAIRRSNASASAASVRVSSAAGMARPSVAA